MNKPRKLGILALGLSLGLAGFGPAAFAYRDHEDDDDDDTEVVESASECSTSQSGGSENSTGNSSQSGLINVNNVGLQLNNLDLLGNLLCQGVFLNDIVVGVLGFASGDGDDNSAGSSDCTTEQGGENSNGTGTNDQNGLVNVNNVLVQGNNLDVLGNLLCGANFLNGLPAGILGSAVQGDDGDDVVVLDDDGDGGDDGDDGDGDGDESSECATYQGGENSNDTGYSTMGGLLNVNNLVVQGNNVEVLGNGLCGSIFLNDLLVSVLGLAIG